jgi:hypothetical protein
MEFARTIRPVESPNHPHRLAFTVDHPGFRHPQSAGISKLHG